MINTLFVCLFVFLLSGCHSGVRSSASGNSSSLGIFRVEDDHQSDQEKEGQRKLHDDKVWMRQSQGESSQWFNGLALGAFYTRFRALRACY